MSAIEELEKALPALPVEQRVVLGGTAIQNKRMEA